MIENFTFSSIKRKKIQEDENDHVVKKSKFITSSTDQLDYNENTKRSLDDILNKRTTIVKNIELVSLIPCEEKKKINICVGQIVWSRCNKTPFWPSIVWKMKTGKTINENNYVFVKRFAKEVDVRRIKSENIFPFDGVESFKMMKNSINMNALTPSIKAEFNFAFNVSNELWPQAVAEAKYCRSKPIDERQTIFSILLMLNDNLSDIRRSSSIRRSKEFQNDEIDLTINKELERITSYFENVDSRNTLEIKYRKISENTSLSLQFIVPPAHKRHITPKYNQSTLTASARKMTPTAYKEIVENTFVSPARLVLDKNNEAIECECNIDVDPCGPMSECLNRMTYTECNDLCPCGSKCQNKSIQQKIHANIYLKFLGDKGFGIISAENIAAGSFVIDYVGEVITNPEYQRRIINYKRQNSYFMKSSKKLFIDAELKGNLSRFINHSCNPNCSYENWIVNGVNVVAIIALNDIPKDTEITCSYGSTNTVPCLCNESNCVKFF